MKKRKPKLTKKETRRAYEEKQKIIKNIVKKHKEYLEKFRKETYDDRNGN